MKNSYLLSLSVILGLSACGGSSSDDVVEDVTSETETETEVEVTTEEDIYGPFSTGSSSEPQSVYFDLDAGQVIELTDEEATSNSVWDIAFNRTKVSLNTHADNQVGSYFTSVNSDFYDENGDVIADMFLNATAESELDDYLAIGNADLPSDEEYSYDSEEYVIGDKFYRYDFTTHIVSAADDSYFIVSSDSAYTKFNAKSITTSGRTMSSLTLGVQHQSALDGETEFAPEVDLVIEAADCSDDLYIDFDLMTAVSADDAWDITLPCITESDITGADFDMHINDEATALIDTANSYTGIDSEAEQFYGFQSDLTQVKALDANPWYQYNLNGGHLLWSQYGVYLLKTSDSVYKLQITSYYDDAGTSGNYSFRFYSVDSE